MGAQLTVLAWGAWLVLLVLGVAFAMARDSHSGYSSVSVPRLLFFLWLLACVLVMLSLSHLAEALVGGVAAILLGAMTFSVSSGSASRKKEFDERLEGARRALAEDPNNSMSHELLGDLYSTLEDEGLARKHWARALELRSDAKLREKLAGLERTPRVFHLWGSPAAHQWRACPACGGVAARLAARCACGAPFFTEPGSWHAAVLDRFCEENGVDALLRLSLLMLPVLFVLGPLPYAAAWLLWAFAVRRPDLPRRESGAGARLRGRAALLLLFAAGAAAAPRVENALRPPRRAPPAAFLPASASVTGGEGAAAALDALLKQAGSAGLDEPTRRLLEEELKKAGAAQGVAAPAAEAYLEEAEKKGLLDRPIPGSPAMTFRGALEKAKGLATRADELAEERARENAEAGGAGAVAPEKAVPEAIALLNAEDDDSRVLGAQMLCDTRVARHPLAQSARAELLRAQRSKNADLAGFAGMALRRLDHFAARREAGAGR